MGLYCLLTDLAAPAISLYLRRRMLRGREDPLRFAERLGQASVSRPPGKVVWCHAASVGEAMSALPLISALVAKDPVAHVLLTTGTVSSARVLANRLPERTMHQYVPVDRWVYVNKFLEHWHPDAVLWVESELWPNMLAAIKARNIPAVLVNGRMSEKSFSRWKVLAPGWAKDLLAAFRLGLAQTEADRARFSALGLCDARYLGNLKYSTAPLSCDADELEKLRQAVGGRAVWLMASTHRGEDEIALAVHQGLVLSRKDILTIIAPRHAERGGEIAQLCAAAGIPCAMRSLDETISASTGVYVCDTMGEMGLLFRMVPVACIAGSFTWDGHNPIEAAQLGCAVVFGPRMGNFAEIARDMLAAGAAIQVDNAASLDMAISRLLSCPEETSRVANAGRMVLERGKKIMADTMRAIGEVLT